LARATLFASEVSVPRPAAVAFTLALLVTLATNESFALFPAASVPKEQTARLRVHAHLRPRLETLEKLAPPGSLIVTVTRPSAAPPRFLSLATNELRRYPL
jgi:hypothetical protein